MFDANKLYVLQIQNVLKFQSFHSFKMTISGSWQQPEVGERNWEWDRKYIFKNNYLKWFLIKLVRLRVENIIWNVFYIFFNICIWPSPVPYWYQQGYIELSITKKMSKMVLIWGWNWGKKGKFMMESGKTRWNQGEIG